MQHSQSSFVTDDGLELYTQSWLSHEPKAHVILLHGYAEHGGRYEHWARVLNEHGYAFHALDHRGHGRSGGQRAQVLAFDNYVTDAGEFASKVRDQAEGKPVFLMGHSMGGTIATLLVLQDQQAWAGLVLCSAALKLVGVPQWQQDLVVLLARALPGLPTVKIDSRVISRDPDMVERYDADPLNYRGGARARWSAQFSAGIAEASSRGDELTLPLLVMYGGADQLIDPAGSIALYKQASALDKTLRTYEPCYHELLNEPEKEQVMADIVAWLEDHL